MPDETVENLYTAFTCPSVPLIKTGLLKLMSGYKCELPATDDLGIER